MLAACGSLGFFVGAILVPTWQDVIEPGQVLAGLVQYPAGNPVLLYSTRAWTVLHQTSALLLLAGVSERTLAIFLSGLVGMLSFQAIGVTIFAIADDVALACTAPFFIFAVGATSGGVAYPVRLAGSPFTSGVVGLSYLLLVCALIGAGEYALGLLLLGFMAAVHVTLGIWSLLIVGLAVWCGGGDVKVRAWRASGWFCLGAALAAVSATAHFARLPRAADLAPDEWARYFAAIVTYWDQHRRPFARLSIQATPFLIGTIVSAVWLRRYRTWLAGSSAVLLGALAASAAIGLLLSVVLAIDPGFARGLLWRAMPSRLMNLPLLACMAVIIGMAGRLSRLSRLSPSSGSLHAELTLASLVGVVALIDVVAVGGAGSVAPFAGGQLAGVSYVAMAAAAWSLTRSTRETSPARPRLPSDAEPPAPRLLWTSRLVTLGTPVVLLILTVPYIRANYPGKKALQDRTTGGIFATTAARSGVLLTASNLHLIQLATRRPILLDGGAIDALPYAPEAAPATERILREVYGIELLAPPFEPGHADGSLPADTGKARWESRSAAEWKAVGDRFGVTDVLTFDDWHLQLPEVSRSDGLALYAIAR